MKKIITSIITIVTAFILTIFYACNGYSSNYKASSFVHTNSSKNASMSFSSFKGTMVFKLKCESENETINYTAKLETGNAKVYYDCNGTKSELFCVNSGEEVKEYGGSLQKGTIYIIVEIPESGKNGSFNFELINDGTDIN